MGDWAPVPDGTGVEEMLVRDGVGDGLPVVPPTASRLDAMLAGTADPDTPLGPVPPLFTQLTVRAAAYHAVLAGCRPAELPVVLATLRACLEPEFNLLGVQTTTGTAAVAVVVRGPVVDQLGMTTGSNLLGPGNRANASVGRAVALALAGIGGARPGETDMATTGWPGRYGMCLPVPGRSGSGDSVHGGGAVTREPEPGRPGRMAATGAAESPRRRGPDRDGGVRPGAGSSVTVLAVGGAAEVLPRGGGGTVDEVLDPLAEMFAGAALAAGDPYRMGVCEQAVVVPPEVAARLSGVDVADELFRRGNAVLAARGLPDARVSAGHDAVHLLVTGGAGIKMLHLPGWIGGSRAVTRAVP